MKGEEEDEDDAEDVEDEELSEEVDEDLENEMTALQKRAAAGKKKKAPAGPLPAEDDDSEEDSDEDDNVPVAGSFDPRENSNRLFETVRFYAKVKDLIPQYTSAETGEIVDKPALVLEAVVDESLKTLAAAYLHPKKGKPLRVHIPQFWCHRASHYETRKYKKAVKRKPANWKQAVQQHIGGASAVSDSEDDSDVNSSDGERTVFRDFVWATSSSGTLATRSFVSVRLDGDFIFLYGLLKSTTPSCDSIRKIHYDLSRRQAILLLLSLGGIVLRKFASQILNQVFPKFASQIFR